jgi:hypothetical protein
MWPVSATTLRSNSTLMLEIIGGRWLAWTITLLYQCAMIFCASSAIIGGVAGLNEFSGHRFCTVALEMPLFVAVCLTASIPKLQHVSWVTWTVSDHLERSEHTHNMQGSLSIFIAVLICVVGVTQLDRPVAAPTGDYDLGYHIFPTTSPAFVDGMVSWLTIFCQSRRPHPDTYADIRLKQWHGRFHPCHLGDEKPPGLPQSGVRLYDFCVVLLSLVGSSSPLRVTRELISSFALVIYKWCGQYVAAPALSVREPSFHIVEHCR